MHFFNENFIVALCFIIFVYFAYRPIKKAINASLDARIKEIKNKLDEAEKIKKDAKLLLNEIEQEMQSFNHKKKSILKNAENSTQRLVQMKIKEMDLLLSRKKDSAIKSIETQKIKATVAMKAEFTEGVINTVRAYLVKTKNNSVSDEEILHLFLKK